MTKRSYHTRADTFSVYIPLNVTADLGIAIKRQREKRINRLKEKYPSLFPKEAPTENIGDSNKDDPSKKNDNDLTTELAATKKPSAGEIRKEDYSSVVDYLEAKYARGVVPSEEKKPKKKKEKKDDKSQDDGKENNDGDDDDSSHEDDRSVYSRDEFIDDSELMTSVAEQVVASSRGMTKIEVEAKKKNNASNDQHDLLDYDDDAFFVNIGSLEMEDGFDENDVSNIDFDALDKSNVLKYVLCSLFLCNIL